MCETYDVVVEANLHFTTGINFDDPQNIDEEYFKEVIFGRIEEMINEDPEGMLSMIEYDVLDYNKTIGESGYQQKERNITCQ